MIFKTFYLLNKNTILNIKMPETKNIISIESDVLKILKSQNIGSITDDLCDFSITEQNASAEAQGIQPSAPSDYVPILGKTVTYIVACVIVNEKNEILMMQEAKESCAGKWYLPAGRIEKGETICEAAERECQEETGLNINVKTILAIESAGGSWFRFVVAGDVIGGTLKTPMQADKESLQAKWVDRVDELPLRATDILNIINLGRSYYRRSISKSVEESWHEDILPTKYSHKKNYIRVIAIIRKRATNNLNILVSEKNVHHFPTVEVHPQRSIHSTLKKFMIEIFGAELPQHKPHGILSIEYFPTKVNPIYDGICLNMLVVFRPPLEEVTLIGKCVWHELSKSIDTKLSRMLVSKNSIISLNVVR